MKKVISKLDKIKDAKNDIEEIENVLKFTGNFNKNSKEIYERISIKNEYSPYIYSLKVSYKMNGNIPFLNLDLKSKVHVLRMFIQAIGMYIDKEIGEELDNNKYSREEHK